MKLEKLISPSSFFFTMSMKYLTGCIVWLKQTSPDKKPSELTKSVDEKVQTYNFKGFNI